MTIPTELGSKGAYNGFGADWTRTSLTETEARRATDWVEAKIDKRFLLTGKERKDDVRDIMWQLEKEREIVVHRVAEHNEPVMAKTLYGWDKKIPPNNLWYHKSCGQCGNIPGYPTSILWIQNQLGLTYLDETDQTSCTAWN